MSVEVGGSETAMWPLALGVLLVVLVIVWRRQCSLSYLLCLAVFGVYLLFALDVTFFPIRIDATYSDGMTPAQFTRSINLISFKFNLSELPNIVLMQIFQNVLLTVPFGFGVNFVTQVTGRSILWLAVAVGLGIEAGQLIISLLLRYPYRIIDINDALLNASGVLIGYGIFRVFAWLYVLATQRFAIKHRGLSAAIYDVASRTQARG